MRAIETVATAAGDVLQLMDAAMPQPAAGELLIAVQAAGVNRPDLLQRQGLYPPPAGASPILGLEVAGTVAAVGAGVSDWAVGDAVCALVTGGGYATYCVAAAVCCLPLPTGMGFIEAAALPETFFTVWSNLFQRGGLQAGETVLIHGGGSGIGTAAIVLAKAFGATVWVTAGSDDKCQRCLQLGAEVAIDYRQQDFVEAVAARSEGRGVDVILDIVGGDYLPRNLKCLALDGRLLQIAVQNGAKAEINLWTVMQKRLLITGSTLRGRDNTVKAAIAQALQQQVWPLLASGQIKPVIDSVFPLAVAEQAHQRLASNQHFGKVVLEVTHGI